MKKVAIYYRVSTDRQDLDSQRGEVEAWLESLPPAKKPKSVRVYQDIGYSGKSDNRPAFNDMIDDAYAHKLDTIIVYKLDRFSRSASKAIRLLMQLDEHGVAFISTSQPVLNLGHDNPFRRTMLAAFAEIGEIERDTIISRVKAGLVAAKKRGVRLGRPPKVSAEQQAKARSLRAEGLTIKRISHQLKLSAGTVSQLIRAPDMTSH